MNLSRAREHFSAYREGELDQGLRTAFEKALASDAELKAEYESFVSAMELLDGSRDEEIEVPIYLSDRIATRLEEAQARKQVAMPLWSGWFRKFALGAVAVAVVGGSIIGITSGGGKYSAGGFLGCQVLPFLCSNSPTRNELEYRLTGNEVVVVFSPNGKKAILVNGQSHHAENEALELPLRNPGGSPSAFTITVDGVGSQDLLIVPGTQRQSASTGTGTVQDFATALSGYYQVPIRISGEPSDQIIRWNFADGGPLLAAETSLEGTKTSASQMVNGLITLQNIN